MTLSLLSFAQTYISLKSAHFCRFFSIQTSPADLSVLERGLVVSDPHWKDIVREEKRYCVHIKKTFQGQVLGYVTPVSSLGNEYIHTGEPFLLRWSSAFHSCNYSVRFFKSVLQLWARNVESVA